MGTYLARLDAAAPAEHWRMARGWLFGEPLPFFAELRAERPVLRLPEVTLVTRHADCMTILRRHQTFGVDLYEPKQGDYFMAQDDTAIHWREKSIMKAILDREELPAMREWIGERARAALRDGNGMIEAVSKLTRAVPVALVEHWFGFRGANPDKLVEWSYWNQQDAFWNQPFDRDFVDDPERIVSERKRANIMLAIYLGRLTLKRSVAVKLGSDADDPVTRLLRLSFSDGVRLNLRRVVQNVGGLLIGAVETTSHAVVNAAQFLLADPARAASARAAAASEDKGRFDGHVWEALRFRPAFPYFFRTVKRPTELAGGTPHATGVSPGETVLAVTHSAMFDPAGFPNPDAFDPGRDFSDTFTFGQGIHDCLGRAISGVMVPEIVRQLFLVDDLKAAAPDYRGGMVPEAWKLEYRPA